jgi:hypothetical protein
VIKVSTVYNVRLTTEGKNIPVSGLVISLKENGVPVAFVSFPVTAVNQFVKSDLGFGFDVYKQLREFVDSRREFDITIETTVSPGARDPNHTGAPIVLRNWVARSVGAPVLGSTETTYTMQLAHPVSKLDDVSLGDTSVLKTRPTEDPDSVLSAYTMALEAIIAATQEYSQAETPVDLACDAPQTAVLNSSLFLERTRSNAELALKLISDHMLWPDIGPHSTASKLPLQACFSNWGNHSDKHYSDLWIKTIKRELVNSALSIFISNFNSLGGSVLPTFFSDKVCVTSFAPWKPPVFSLPQEFVHSLHIAAYNGEDLGGVYTSLDLGGLSGDLSATPVNRSTAEASMDTLGFIPEALKDKKYYKVQAPTWPLYMVTASQATERLNATSGAEASASVTATQKSIYRGAVYTCLKDIFMVKYLQQSSLGLAIPQFFGSAEAGSISGFLYPGIVIRLADKLDFYVTAVQHTIDNNEAKALTHIEGTYLRHKDFRPKEFGTLENPLYA